MEHSINNFARYLGTEKNLSIHTQRNYLADIRQFQAFALKRGITAVDEIGRDVIGAFMTGLYMKKVKKVTISRKLSSLRSFFRYLMREGRIGFNPAQLVQTPKA